MEGISRRTGLAAVALCALGGLTATPIYAGGAITTSAFLPLQGTVFIPSDPCTPTPGERVSLTGLSNVVTIVPPTPIAPTVPPTPIKLHFNLANVIGTGSVTHNTYIGTGAATFNFTPTEPCIPTDPCHPPSVQFSLESTVGCASQPLIVNFSLALDATGHLLPDASSASFQCTIDNPSICRR
jgi:hypothetical protein